MNLRPSAIHPYLFALFPVLSLFAVNIHETWPSELILPVVIVLAVTLLLDVAGALARVTAPRRSILISLFWLFVFSVPLSEAAEKATAIRAAGTAAVVVPFLLLVAYFARTRRDLAGLSRIANATAIFLIVTALFPLMRGSFRVAKDPAVLRTAPEIEELRRSLRAAPRPASTPDIYYLVFDQYGGEETLRSVFKHDNRGFLDALRKRGFYVADRSLANYPRTAYALSANLNLTYTHGIAARAAANPDDWKPIVELIRHHEAGAFLQRLGYQYVHMGTMWDPSSKSPIADLNINRSTTLSFATLLFQNSVLARFLASSDASWDMRHTQWEGERHKLEILGSIGERFRQPVFVFAHFLTTHEPFVFRGDGSFLPKESERALGRDAAYREALQYTNAEVLRVVEKLIENGRREGRPPVIILQADEGPYPLNLWHHPADYRWMTASHRDLLTKSAIFNAMLLPGIDPTHGPYPSISPVNTFRVVFNGYFGTKLPLLPDETLFFESLKDIYRMYRWDPVTGSFRKL